MGAPRTPADLPWEGPLLDLPSRTLQQSMATLRRVLSLAEGTPKRALHSPWKMVPPLLPQPYALTSEPESSGSPLPLHLGTELYRT